MQLLELPLGVLAEMHKELNKPIFVVGSPRSGTSVPIWCPGRSAYFENQTQTLFDMFKGG